MLLNEVHVSSLGFSWCSQLCPNHEQEAGAAYKKKKDALGTKEKKIYQELGWIGSLDDERDSRLVLLSSSSLDCCVRACDCDPWER
jgi:hypothetical protein